MNFCWSCDAPVTWVATDAREDKPMRRMPVDANEDGTPTVVADGNLRIVGHEPDGTPVVRYVPKGKGLHSATRVLLAVIDEHAACGRVTISDVERRTKLSRQVVHKFLRRLRRDGLVDWQDGTRGTLHPCVRRVL